LNDEVAEGMVRKTGNPHFVYDSYRRFVQMYGDVVLGMKPVNKEDIDPFEAIIDEVKAIRGIELDKDLSVDELKDLVARFKKAIKEQTGNDFPTDPMEQLWGAICAVFRSWMNERAIFTVRWRAYPMNGVRRFLSWPWYLAIWAKRRLRVFVLAAMPQLVRTCSTASTL